MQPQQPPPVAYDFALAVACLGNYRRQLKQLINQLDSQPEASIRVTDARDIDQGLYAIDQAYKTLCRETGRLN